MAHADLTDFFGFDVSQPILTRVTPATTLALGERAGVTGTDGGELTTSATRLPDGNGSFTGGFLFDYYYRIWVFPTTLRIENGTPGTNYPIHVWNAFPSSETNTDNQFIATSDPHMLVSLTAPSAFGPLEYRPVSVQITAATPRNGRVQYRTTFDAGVATQQIILESASVSEIFPEVPVTETWTWYTDILVAYNGLEQRVALRAQPRRGMKFDTLTLTAAEYRIKWLELLSGAKEAFLMPFFQYAAEVLAAAPAATSTLSLQSQRGEFRVGEYVNLVGPDGSQLVTVANVTDTTLTIDPALTSDLPAGSLAIPCLYMLNSNKTEFNMAPYVLGKISVDASSKYPSASLARPGASPARVQMDGFEVLIHRPNVYSSNAKDTFDHGGDLVDYSSGIQDIVSTVKNPFITLYREWIIQRVFNPGDMDYWRAVWNDVCGSLKPMWLPTWREDYNIVGFPSAGALTVTLQGNRYSSLRAKSDLYHNLLFTTAQGLVVAKVTSYAANGDGFGNDTVTFDIAYSEGGTLTTTYDNSVSAIIKVRSADDTVTIDHYGLYSVMMVNLRSTEQ